MSDKDGFGKPVEDCTGDQLVTQIIYHRKQLAKGEDGTPNVHVRLGALERELMSRQKEPTTQVLRKLKRDIVISVTHKELVGVYFEDSDGSEVLMECSPENADKIIGLWNDIIDDELEE